MPNLLAVVAVAGAVGWLAAAGAGWALKGAYEAKGKVTAELSTCVAQLKEAELARKERDATDRAVRDLPNDSLFDRLR